MNTDVLVNVLISSIIFTFPRKFPTKLYTTIKRIFKKKKKDNQDLDKFPSNIDLNNPEEVQLEQDFRKACKIVEKSASLDVAQSLEFYGLYKQSLFGDVNISMPDPDSIEAFKKWEAWFDRKGLTSQGAKREYIRLVESFAPDFRESNDNLKEESEEAIFLTDEEYNKRKKEEAEDEKPKMKLTFSKPVMGEGLIKTEIVDEEDIVTNFMALIDDDNLEEIERLIKKGYDLNKQNASGMRPIHYAIENEKEEVFELLSKHYEDLDIPDITGMTPLHYAVTHENEKIIEILLQRKVDIYKPDNDGESPIDMATSQIKKFIENYLGVQLQ